MTSIELCEHYLAGLNSGDLDAVLALFTPDAQVSSPLYGVRDARSFYTDLFADTERSETQLLNVFDTSSGGPAIALHFEYDWTLGSGKLVKFECVDVFELTEDAQRFRKITIIYDTAHLRADFEASSR
ncbi:nuclear transport factor 2 family protein [Sphingomonas sp. H39-1-10]|uniref:nuclear transport factor 2 family protein n=1 Tax=Sphingomonas pollutisoli TaxID=3030829 RepID=UPI0023B91610|nr:nuclear transport factor 2 family protein [Sphingomonas pollutisoli]MDF0490404.1 nuclear transport factor 2 family protein [Sphingomonas pollutisoli]